MSAESKMSFETYFDKEVEIYDEDSTHHIFRMKNETGEGLITGFNILPGIDCMLNDFNMTNGFNQNKLPKPNIIEFNHCIEGRFECELRNGECTYLGVGDLSLSRLTDETKFTSFPLAKYKGMSIIINVPEAKAAMKKIAKAFNGLAVDIDVIIKKINNRENCWVIRNRPEIDRIFCELYANSADETLALFKIKVIELLYFLSNCNESENDNERKYFYRNQVMTVKAIREFLVSNPKKHITLAELSDRFKISLTSMKTCFKGVYGMSIYAYMKDFRMQMAALRLKESQDSVTEVANQMGYENASKFSEAFKSKMGVSPTEFRKNAD